MRTLAELKERWFLDFTSPVAEWASPPIARHSGSAVKDYTDGNWVTPLIEGAAFMTEWQAALRNMVAGGNPAACEVWLSGWLLQDVRTKGYSDPASDALEVLRESESAGVKVLGMISRHVPNMPLNYLSVGWLTTHGLAHVLFDNRFPILGSGHQKFTCIRDPANPHCMLGSIDLAKARWDRPMHAAVDSERDPHPLGFGPAAGPTHDAGVVVHGPAVADIETTFKERWNDSTRAVGLLGLAGPLSSAPLITAPVNIPPAVPDGTHSVQVLHTYGRTSAALGYSWSPVGEYTVWASYLNAIRKAETYIYIEDQYFFPFDWKPCFARRGWAKETDIVYQIGERIKNGVKVAVLVPTKSEDPHDEYQRCQRDAGVEYLHNVAASPEALASNGSFLVASRTNGTSDVYVHTKVMIVDDEFVLIGSANINQRSMSFDSEIHLGVIDEANLFAKTLRLTLWGEHLGAPEALIDDPVDGYTHFKSFPGGVKPYLLEPTVIGLTHPFMIREIIDPYGGPVR